MQTTKGQFIRRLALAMLAVVMIGLFVKAALIASPDAGNNLFFAAAGIVFGGIVVRLAQASYAAEAGRRRRAHRLLAIISAIPMLVLVPSVIQSSPPELTPGILLGTAVWISLAMSFTSFMLAGDTAVESPTGLTDRPSRRGRFPTFPPPALHGGSATIRR